MSEKKKLQNMKTKELAEWLHDNYKEIIKRKNLESQKPFKFEEFEDLPEENKQVMVSLARRIHKHIN